MKRNYGITKEGMRRLAQFYIKPDQNVDQNADKYFELEQYDSGFNYSNPDEITNPEDLYEEGVSDSLQKDLVEAIKAQDVKKVRKLIESGADPTTEETAIIYASEGHSLNIMIQLIEAGADVHAWNDSALRSAAKNGNNGMVTILLDAGADVDAMDSQALKLAVEGGYEDVVESLIDAGSSVSNLKNPPLAAALKNKNNNIIKMLTDAGATY